MNRHGGEQDISATSYFQKARTQTHRGELSPSSSLAFCRQCVDRGHIKTMGRCSCFYPVDTEERQRLAGQGGSLTDLMRGTLSSVQHKVGPLCKYSSSSHDWLYNLEYITCKSTYEAKWQLKMWKHQIHCFRYRSLQHVSVVGSQAGCPLFLGLVSQTTVSSDSSSVGRH